MKSRPDCISCLFTQALNTARHVTDDPGMQCRILRETARYVAESASLDVSPAVLSKPVYELISKLTGVSDPYERAKEQTNRLALEFLPEIGDMVESAADPLEYALRAAVAGNVIDFGIGRDFDFHRDVLPLLSKPFAANDLPKLRAQLTKGCRVLYLGDNCGEIVLDTLLVRQLMRAGAEVTFAVKSAPIINDATLRDAERVGMTQLTRVIETGANDIGTILANCSPAFRQEFARADVIIAKGHGNFETCNETAGNFFFLLKIKCAIVALELGIPAGEIVFVHRDNRHAQ